MEQEKLSVRAYTLKEFKGLLKTSYLMGYKFKSGKKYQAFWPWFLGYDVICFYEEKRIKYAESKTEFDYVDVVEFYNIISGNI